MKEVTIKPKLNGWVVEVGCKEVVFSSKSKMLSEIGRYIDNPSEVADEYTENSKNKQLDGSVTFGTDNVTMTWG